MSTRTKNATGDAMLAKLESKAASPRFKPYDQPVTGIMTTDVAVCRPTDTLERCAQIMWERACGCVPVVDDEDHPIAMVTDRDVCMAAYTQGKPLASISVASMMSKQVHAIASDETIATAEAVMRRHGIRRLPVVDKGRRLIGLLSFSDIVTHGHLGPVIGRDGLSANAIAETIASISHVSPR